MIIDIHTHIFPNEIRKNRSSWINSDKNFELLYSSENSKLAGVEDLISSMDQNCVDKSVIFGFPWKDENIFKSHNNYIIDSVKKYPERLIGFGCFDLFSSRAEDEAIRCIEKGLKGIGELAVYGGSIDKKAIEALEPVMKICLEQSLPVMIHTNEPVGHIYPGKTPQKLIDIYNLVKHFPKNNIILAHWGGGILFYNLLKKEVKELFKNVYFDTAASPYLYDPSIYRTASSIAGKEKVLFGSDYPLLSPARYYKDMEEGEVSSDEKDYFLGKSAGKLLNV